MRRMVRVLDCETLFFFSMTIFGTKVNDLDIATNLLFCPIQCLCENLYESSYSYLCLQVQFLIIY